MFSVSRDAVGITTCIIKKSEWQPSHHHKSYHILLNRLTMAPFLSFLALEIRILTEILHQIQHDYAECYLVSPQKAHNRHETVGLV